MRFNIYVYYRFKITEANPCPIYVLIGDQPERRLQHLGCDKLIAFRHMNIEEQQDYKNSTRYHHVKYKCWEALIDDEKQLTQDQSFLNKLEEAKEKYSIASNIYWQPALKQYELFSEVSNG